MHDREITVSSMDPQEKIAIVMAMLGKNISAEILSSLPEGEREAILQKIEGLKDFPEEIILRCLTDFMTKMHQEDSLEKMELPECLEEKEKEAEPYQPPYQEENLHPHKEGEINLVAILNQANPGELAHYFREEDSQTVALILSSLDGARNAQILVEMPLEKQVDILITFVFLQHYDPAYVQEVLQTTESVLGIPLSSNRSFLRKACEILENILPEQRETLMIQVAEANPEIAEEINAEILLFDEVQHLSQE